MLWEAEFHLKTYNDQGKLVDVKIYPTSYFNMTQSRDNVPIYPMGLKDPVNYIARAVKMTVSVALMNTPLSLEPKDYIDYRGCPSIPEMSLSSPFVSNYMPDLEVSNPDLARRASKISLEE